MKDLTIENQQILEKVSIFKNTKFIFAIALCAIVISVACAIAIVIINLGKTKTSSGITHWSHADQDAWPGLCKTGKKQSPINLESETAIQIETSLNFGNIGYYDTVEVANDGHSVVVKFNVSNSSKPRLSGGGLLGDYVLDNLHFHWPSEHYIDGEELELEAHFVFYSEQYPNITTALKFDYGVTVVGILFDEVRTRGYNDFRIIDDAVEEVAATAGTSTYTTAGITLSDFFPEDGTIFRYTGSLTTPNCTENINWIVFKAPSTISKTDLKRLASIYTSEGELLESNNRYLQKINDREIYVSGN